MSLMNYKSQSVLPQPSDPIWSPISESSNPVDNPIASCSSNNARNVKKNFSNLSNGNDKSNLNNEGNNLSKVKESKSNDNEYILSSQNSNYESQEVDGSLPGGGSLMTPASGSRKRVIDDLDSENSTDETSKINKTKSGPKKTNTKQGGVHGIPSQVVAAAKIAGSPRLTSSIH